MIVSIRTYLSVHFHFDFSESQAREGSAVSGLCVLSVYVHQYLGKGLFWNRSGLPQCRGRKGFVLKAVCGLAAWACFR